MEKQRLNYLIENPTGFTLQDTIQLRNLCEQFPYVGTFKQLYLIALKEKNDVQFNQSLQEFALYIPSRQKLKDFVDQKTELLNKQPRFKEPLFFSVEQEIKSTQKEETQIDSYKEENSLGKLESENHTAEKENEEIVSIEAELSSEMLFDYEKDKSLGIINSKSNKKSFSAWLTSKVKTEINKPNLVEPKKEIQKNIIEKFIKEEPKISPLKESYTPEKQTLDNTISMVNREDYVTETLAQVYEKQGNFNKAIASFGKLKLKYPEKSDYFAAQIERLNQLKKNKE